MEKSCAEFYCRIVKQFEFAMAWTKVLDSSDPKEQTVESLDGFQTDICTLYSSRAAGTNDVKSKFINISSNAKLQLQASSRFGFAQQVFV
jgi:hypothetical protein